jgi:type I restriction enzyme S subunit
MIAAHNDKLEALKDHKKGLMQNLFPQEGQKVPNYRFPEFVKDGEWGIKQVDEYFDVGSSKRVLQKDWTNKGVPFYRTRELVSLSKNEPFGSEIYISESLYSELKKKYGVPSEGDFLVSGVGTLGISYQVKESDKFYFKDGNVLWFELKGDLNSSYFKFCFESEHLQNQINAQTSKSTVGTYTIQNAKKTEFWYPPKPQEQQKIASCLSALDELITAQSEKIEQLQQHKKGLMQGLFPKIES